MLPALREELTLYPAPAAANGAPTWSLHDPVRNVFFRIDWLTFELLSRWHLHDGEAILKAVEQDTPIHPQPSDLESVLRFLTEGELIQRHDAEGSAWMSDQATKRASSLAQWLLHHYLFFRVPLWAPDAWLERAQPWVSFFYSRAWFYVSLAALALGLFEVSSQWDVFTSTALDMFSWQGMGSYFITLICVKFLHELGHAFTAKRFGCRVPTMGVAFLVMFPMAYTDINETWKLPNRRQRLAVGGAGILIELMVAAWATLAWALLPDGLARSAAFLLATTTWISTIAINASPFMRFDGYFLLMDWLDLPNLHARAFALARWRMRETLFDLKEVIPESFSRRRQWSLLVFAYGTWTYRLIVFSGIAIMVYTLFPKPLGPLLTAVEIGFFILLPIMLELKAWKIRFPLLLKTRRTRMTAGLLLVLLGMSIVPWDTRVRAQGILKPALAYPLVAPGGARIKTLPIANTGAVGVDQVLIELESPDLVFQQRAASARANALQWQVTAAGVDAKLRDRQTVIEAERNKVEAEIDGLGTDRKRYTVRSPFAGHLFLANPDISVGTWVSKNEKLGELVDLARWRVETYLPEADLARIRVGDSATFFAETPEGASFSMRVDGIDRDATRVLPEGLLASTRGGALLVREQNKQFIPETAVYRVSLSLVTEEKPRSAQIQRGSVVIRGESKALLTDFVRNAAALFRREAGF